MSVTRVRDEGQTLKYPKGKLIGIVDTRADFDRLVPALRDAAFDKIEALVGEEGVGLLERIGTFFFSDMEERVINRHIEELKAGHVIVAIEAPHDRVAEAASSGPAGARRARGRCRSLVGPIHPCYPYRRRTAATCGQT